MKTIDKLKKQVRAAVKAGVKDAPVITFPRSAFKKELSSTNGFGAQDLKPTYHELYIWMLKTYTTKLSAKPTSGSRTDLSVSFYVK